MTTPDQQAGQPRISITLTALLLLAVCIAVYVQGLFGGFMFDDYENIVNNPTLPLVDGSAYRWLSVALSSDSGVLMRPVSMLSFGLNHYLFGMDPIAFKAVNLLIHLLCGMLLYALSLRVLPFLSGDSTRGAHQPHHQWVALLVAALWLLHPLHVSDVVYIVQRMNQLAALFVLAGLCCYVEGRTRMLRNERGTLIAASGLLTFGLLATLSKENGALIFAYALIIETVCFRFRQGNGSLSRSTATLFLLLIALPALAAITFVATHPEWLSNRYAVRDFTLMERVLTQPRILLHYLYWTFIPLPSLMGLYHDDIPLSTGILTPPTTLAAIAVLIFACIAAWRTRRTLPGIALAVGWFLVGHSMESTILPLEIVFEHRNYLPMTGVILGAVAVASNSATVQRHGRHATMLSVLALLLLASATAIRNHSWRSPISLAMDTARHHPESPRSLYDAGRAVMFAASQGTDDDKRQARIEARAYFVQAMALDETDPFSAIAHVLTFFDGADPVSEEIASDLEYRLRHMPLFKATPVLRLFDAISEGRISMSPDSVRKLFEASMENPSISSPQRAMMLNNYGRYHFVALGNPQEAVSLTLAAAAEQPHSPLFKINLAKLALALKQPQRARIYAQSAEETDRTEVFAPQIKSVHKQIATFESSLPEEPDDTTASTSEAAPGKASQ